MILLLILAALAGPIDEVKLLESFKQAFAPLPKNPISVEGCQAAIQSLLPLDSPGVAQALTGAYTSLEKALSDLESRRRDAVQGQEYEVIVSLRQKIDPLQSLQLAILESVTALRKETTLEWIVNEIVVQPKMPLTLKLTVARAAEDFGARMLELLTTALKRAKDADTDLLILLEGVGQFGAEAKLVGPDVVKLVSHKDPLVRERAAWLFSRIESDVGIAPLIQQLGKEEGRLERKIAAALEELTREKLGTSAEAWRRWLEDHEKQIDEGLFDIGGGTSTVGVDLGQGQYHDIPQEGRSIVYVIDRSGSMVLSWTNPEFHGTLPVPAPEGEDSRLDVTQRELNRALGQLPQSVKFNIIAYGEHAELYSEKLVEATPGQVKKAQTWVSSMDAYGSTNIHDAMEMAFKLAGHGAIDRYYKPSVDTIFLLTDGQPTFPDGSLDSTDRILQAVRKWNPYKGVVVHTIGLGKNLQVNFLADLAQENGGIFVHKKGS